MIYNDCNIDGDPRLLPMVRYTTGYFWGGPATSPDRLNPDKIDWRILDHIAQIRDRPLVINIEGPGWENPGGDPAAMERWIDLIKTVRRVHRSSVGIYRMIPERAYIQPVRHFATDDPAGTHRAWRLRNNRLFGLADSVDAIYPSLYPQPADLYRKPEHWRAIVKANLREAKQYDKPVRPYVTPQFRGMQDEPLLSLDEWLEQLTVVRQQVKDIVLYFDGKHPIPTDYLQVAVDLFGGV